MRRLAVPGLVALALVAAPSTASSARLPATAKLVACDAAEGRASFQGRMTALSGTERMWMRFTLLERDRNGLFRPVSAPGLDVWRRSRPRVMRFLYTQEVANLKPGSAYRMTVQHRWLRRDGTTIRSTRRRSSACATGGALPNLRVRSISARPGPQPGATLYRVTVRNLGAADARGVRVALTVDGTPLTGVTVDVLRAFEAREVEIAGPACASGLTAVVDPDNTVRESSEDDNLRTAPCPPG